MTKPTYAREPLLDTASHRRIGCLAAGALLACTACHLMFPYDSGNPDAAALDGVPRRDAGRQNDLSAPETRPGDGRPVHDLSRDWLEVRDAPADAPRPEDTIEPVETGVPDLRPADVLYDWPLPPDVFVPLPDLWMPPKPDLAVPDLPPLDSSTDLQSQFDTGPEAGPEDTGILDGQSSGPCQAGTAAIYTWPGGKMVVCDAGEVISQCYAYFNCYMGWHLCTAAEYQQHGGMTSGSPKMAWLKSCVVNNSNVQAPSNDYCIACNTDPGTQVSITWTCATTPTAVSPNADKANMGLVAWTDCRRVGLNNKDYAAFWKPEASHSYNVQHAACCRD